MAGNTLAQKLKVNNVRAQLLLTQQQLADRAGISRRSVANAETGGSISRLTAFAILKVFNMLRKEDNLPELGIEDLDWNIWGGP